MKILKRTTVILFIFLFLLSPVGLNMACPVPTYAADEWEDVTKADLVTAFKYYCKSRNLAIEGSLADALTTFTTDTFNNLVNTLGIDSDAIQAELKKTTQGNLGLRFLFTQTGVNFYNRIFAEFLQNNDFSVGDEIENEVLQSGDYYFNDYEGIGAFVTEVNVSGPTANNDKSQYSSDDGLQYLIKLGTPYKYSTSDIYNLYTSARPDWTSTEYRTNPINLSFYFSADNHYTGSLYSSIRGGYDWIAMLDSGYTLGTSSPNVYDRIFAKSTSSADSYSSLTAYGFPCILRYTNKSGYLYLATISFDKLSVNRMGVKSRLRIVGGTDDVQSDVNIYVTTNNTTINNNDYSKDYTIIYNDGDYYDIDHNYPSPDTPPGGGGGGGGDNPDSPTPPSSTPPDWDIELPDTDIDWIIRGMEERFPWDIPFNVMFALSLLNAEPETPHFEGTIDLKVVEWNYDIDLEPFDEIAGYFRKFFFLGFLVWLLLVTKKLIWG